TIAISRAGASSITELSLYQIPALFVPFPHAVYNHQLYNAKEIESLGGGLVLEERDASLDRVLNLLERIIQDREFFSERIGSFANPVACQLMIEYILK
ncbi:MAG: undecaprenyldiphospho-muramoylpentapeptide beta-N-acetylglucosaminyltransferase, partial [Aquificaceae bacterium]|nr:undecaprenyldiphospho-muramoylpentapeptide beta-N-acetylglucosaminyltransferase [Aquificaceae bacterium]